MPCRTPHLFFEESNVKAFHRIVIILHNHGLGLYKIILMRARAFRVDPQNIETWIGLALRGHKGESLLMFSREIARKYQNQPGQLSATVVSTRPLLRSWCRIFVSGLDLHIRPQIWECNGIFGVYSGSFVMSVSVHFSSFLP